MRRILGIAGALALTTIAADGTGAQAGQADRAYVSPAFVSANAADAFRHTDNVEQRAPQRTAPAGAPWHGFADDAYKALALSDGAAAMRAADGQMAAYDPVARALRERLAEEAAGRDDLSRYYAENGHEPLWVEDGRLSLRAAELIERIGRADEVGLDPTRYQTPRPDLGRAGPAMAGDLAAAELALSTAAIAYAADARAGRIDPADLAPEITADPQRPDPVAVLRALAGSDRPADRLEAYNPRHPGFRALREKLAELRSRELAPRPPRIDNGRLIRPGDKDSRIPELRRRLDLVADRDTEIDSYDRTLVAAVEAFQDRYGLVVDGIVGPATIRALNARRDVTVADILINMERWRWLPPDMGGDHYVRVNIPEYRLRVVSGDETTFETRVIVGMAERQTPVFSDEVEYLEVNPYWNVPRSIAARDLLPEVREDPASFNRRGIQVLYNQGGRTYQVDPRSIDWSEWSGSDMPFRFRQVPGARNALGQVKFMFPNQHAVYLHDTPSRNLFQRSQRTFSSGCVRVEDPIAFADALLALEPDMDGARVQSLIDTRDTRAVHLENHVPVHLTYFTASVGEDGEIRLHPDIYDQDAELRRALGVANPELSAL